jgi:hypothetical protein
MVMTTPNLGPDQCPHCFTADPALNRQHVFTVQAAKLSRVGIGANEVYSREPRVCGQRDA